jgi:hypothetical protein
MKLWYSRLPERDKKIVQQATRKLNASFADGIKKVVEARPACKPSKTVEDVLYIPYVSE